MATRTQMLASRADAGAAYAAAAAAYVAAYVELEAHDAALGGSSRLMTGGFPALQPPTPHSVFLPDYIHGNASGRIASRVRELGVPTGD